MTINDVMNKGLKEAKRIQQAYKKLETNHIIEQNKTGALEYTEMTIHNAWLMWQSATAEANKRIAELESEVDYLKSGIAEELEQTILDLQASNNDLKDALYVAFAYCPDNQSFDYIETLLATTPAETIKDDVVIFDKKSLQAHDDELIEKCAKVCDVYGHGWHILGDEIRALKGKHD